MAETTPRRNPSRSTGTPVYSEKKRASYTPQETPTKRVKVAAGVGRTRDNDEEEEDDDEDDEEDDEEESESSSAEEEEESDSSFDEADSEEEESDSDDADENEDESDDDYGVSKGAATPRTRKKLSAAARKAMEEREAKRAARIKKRKQQPRKRPTLPTTNFKSLDLNNVDLNPFQRAKAHLHVAATPEYLPCRDNEFEEIEAYLEDSIEEGTGCCIYVAGVPGTGKTATVNSVVEVLKSRVSQDELLPFKYLEINAMKLTEPNQVFPVLWEFISGGQVSTPRHSLELLDKYFRAPNPDKETCVVLVDELDQLVTKSKQKQDVIYNLFDWPNQPYSKLVVLAIANTMDLPERELSGKVRSRLGSNRINFAPYKQDELVKIIEARLQSLGGVVFEKSAIALVAVKVAKITGDARRALDVCRRTVEKVERENAERAKKGQPAKLVGPPDVNATYNEMITSGHSAFLKAATLHEKILLLSLARSIRKVGLDYVDIGTVMKYHLTFCRQNGFEDAPHQDTLFSIVSRLASMRLLLTESGRLAIWMKVSPNLKDSDLELVLKKDKYLGRLVGRNGLL